MPLPLTLAKVFIGIIYEPSATAATITGIICLCLSIISSSEFNMLLDSIIENMIKVLSAKTYHDLLILDNFSIMALLSRKCRNYGFYDMNAA